MKLSLLYLTKWNSIIVQDLSFWVHGWLHGWLWVYGREKFNETTLPGKEEFHCNFNLEDVTDADYMHA